MNEVQPHTHRMNSAMFCDVACENMERVSIVRDYEIIYHSLPLLLPLYDRHWFDTSMNLDKMYSLLSISL